MAEPPHCASCLQLGNGLKSACHHRAAKQKEKRCPNDVPTMTDSHPTNQSQYGILREHIANHPIRLALIQSAPRPTCDDPACILSTVLQEGQALTYLGRGVGGGIV